MPDTRLAPILKVLERLPVSAVLASPLTGKVLWVNSQNVEMAGARHPDDLLGMNLLDFIQPSQHATALRDLAAVALGQSPRPVVYHLRRLDGGTADGHISSVPVIYEGQPAMLSLIVEVTEQERALRELRESEQRYRSLVDTLPDGLTVVADERFVVANRAFAALVGYDDPSALIGMQLAEFIHPASRKLVRTVRRRALMEKVDPQPYRVELVSRDGGSVSVIANTAVIRWEGEIATQTVVRRTEGCDE